MVSSNIRQVNALGTRFKTNVDTERDSGSIHASNKTKPSSEDWQEMAHLVRLAALTDELVSALTSLSVEVSAVMLAQLESVHMRSSDTPQNNPRKFNSSKESAFRALKSQNHPRTNHFDVQAGLEGLEEKFRVFNQDSLADLLHERLVELEEATSDKWTPEILNLLLLISDQPVKNVRLEELWFLRPPVTHSEPVLKWEDLVKEDPELSDQSIWRNVNFAVESSEEEFSDSEIEEAESTRSTAQSIIEDEYLRTPHDFAVLPDNQGLIRIKESQFWIEKLEEKPIKTFELFPQKIIHISELQSVREVLFMLAGLPTSLFRFGEDDEIVVNKDFRLKSASSEVFHDLLSSFADYGSAILSLRKWSQSNQNVVLLQSLQDQVANRIHDFDKAITRLQTKYVALTVDTVISLTEVNDELQSTMIMITKLADIIYDVRNDAEAQAFKCLDRLYDATCLSQMAGEEDVYEFIGTLFFDCLNVYLLPIRTWMEHGELRKDDKTFFITKTDVEVDLISIWQDGYRLRKTQQGVIHCPKFLMDLAPKIFNAGKSVVVLKELGRFREHDTDTTIGSIGNQTEYESQWQQGAVPQLDFKTVCSGGLILFAPFSENFSSALGDWVQNNRNSVSSTLRDCLFEHCGLTASLDALQRIYFMADGFTSAQFMEPIFSKLYAGKASWSDRFSLTELAQSTLGLLASVKSDSLKASVTSVSRYSTVVKARRTVKSLSMLNLHYRLPWPVQIIIPKSSIQTYQAISILLFQIRRSESLLDFRILHDPLNTTSSADERALYYSIRARLLWFQRILYTYLTSIVLQTNTQKMHRDLSEAEDVDHMIRVHQDYIKRIKDQALLGTRLNPIWKTIIAILDLAIHLDNAKTKQISNQSQFSASTVSDSRMSTSKLTDRKRRRVQANDTDSSDDEEPSILEDDHRNQDDLLNVDADYIDQLRHIRATFDHLLRFLRDGLRSVARAEGGKRDAMDTHADGASASTNWEVLAAMLEA